MVSYDTIAGEALREFVEKKSRFIGVITPVTDETATQAFLASRRAAHRDASHHCYAYILREQNILRYSDDGEPQGTAGMPILEVLRREDLWNVALVITRYFGGTLLGAGGLTRAYAHTATLAVTAAQRVTMCPCTLFLLTSTYPLYEQVKLLLESHGAQILDTDFAADITFQIRLRTEMLPDFRKALTELSGGKMEATVVGEEFAAIAFSS
jgi:uncharacterized YigZ family protein